jgi:hypothetical protein
VDRLRPPVLGIRFDRAEGLEVLELVIAKPQPLGFES